MKLLKPGNDDALIQEAWFIFWLFAACYGAGTLWHGAGVLFTFSAICAIRAKRSP